MEKDCKAICKEMLNTLKLQSRNPARPYYPGKLNYRKASRIEG